MNISSITWVVTILLIIIVVLIILIDFLKKKRCVLCDKKSGGYYYKFTEKEILDSDIVAKNKIDLFKQIEEVEDGIFRACHTCGLEIKKNLVGKNKAKIPKKVKKYFKDKKNLLFFQIRKTEIKPLLLISFIVFAFIGLYVHKDINSLCTLIGIEGLIIYPIVWIIYNNVYWHAYIGNKGIIFYQNYIFFNLFYESYSWDIIRNYSMNKNEIRFNLLRFGPLSTLFHLTLFVPLTYKKRRILERILKKNNVPIKKSKHIIKK